MAYIWRTNEFDWNTDYGNIILLELKSRITWKLLFFGRFDQFGYIAHFWILIGTIFFVNFKSKHFFRAINVLEKCRK